MSWLNDPATTYPVTIDPVVNLATGAHDTFVQYNLITPQPSSSVLHVGMTGLLHMVATRALLKFDGISQLAGGQVLNASLSLWNNGTSSCTPTSPLVADPLSEDFADSTVWLNKPAYTTDYESTSTFGYGATGCPSNMASIDLTGMVAAWSSGALANHGVQLMATKEVTNYPFWDFCSLDYVGGAGDCNTASHVPTLSVSWLPPPPAPVDDSALCAQPAADDVCAATPAQSAWSDAPELQATTTDPLGFLLGYTFEVWTSDGTNPTGTAPVATTTVGGLLSGITAIFKPQLANSGLYQYRVKVTNGLTSTLWSAWHVFTTTVCTIAQALPDSTDLDPVTGAVVQVLNWSLGDLLLSQTLEPVGFDASAATDDQLEFYGLPRRPADPLDPNDSESQEVWAAWHAEVDPPEASHLQAFGPDSFCAVTPTSGGQTGGPMDSKALDSDYVPDPGELTDPTNVAATPETSGNWGGEEATAHSNYKYVTGEITVPAYTQCDGNPDSHLSWVGLGGDGVNRLLQNGITSGGVFDTWSDPDDLTPRAWWEVISASHDTYMTPVPESKFKVRSGDDVVFSTTYLPAQHKVKFYWHNKTAPRVKSATVVVTGKLDKTTADKAEPGHLSNYYDGSSAEAIDERAGFGGKYGHNRQHGVTHWINARVSTTNSSSTVPIRKQAHLHITMKSGSTGDRLDRPSTIQGFPAKFNMTWLRCGPIDREN